MTRKHYQAIADAVKSTKTHMLTPSEFGENDPNYNQAVEATIRQLSYTLANELAAFNPGFDRARFISACGIERP